MPHRHAYLRPARHWIANRGWQGFLEQILWRLQLKLQGKPVPGREGPDKGPHPFDREYSVDTAGLVWGKSLHSTNADSTYWATGILTADATTAEFPEDPLVLFLYHPFAAPPMHRFPRPPARIRTRQPARDLSPLQQPRTGPPAERHPRPDPALGAALRDDRRRDRSRPLQLHRRRHRRLSGGPTLTTIRNLAFRCT